MFIMWKTAIPFFDNFLVEISCFLNSSFNPSQNATNEFYQQRFWSFSSTSPNFIIQRAFITPKVTVKEEALVIEKASEEVEEIDEEVALILTDFQFPNQAKVEHRYVFHNSPVHLNLDLESLQLIKHL